MYYNKQNFIKNDGHVTMLRPAFFTCGCGSITSKLGSVLQYCNIKSNQLDQVRTVQSPIAKEWLAQEGLYDKIPLLKQHVYGVLITPDGDWLDISQGAPVNVAERFQKMYLDYMSKDVQSV